MRRWLWFLVLGAGFVIASQSLVYALDPPHSRDSGVDCAACHGVSVFLNDNSGMTVDELRTAYNNMCLQCHDQTGGSYHGVSAPTVKAHDSDITITYGGGANVFHTDCMDCHHPHFQNQQVYWGRRMNSAGQLFFGRLVPSGITYDTDPTYGPVTIAQYDPATLVVKTGSVWDTSGETAPDGDNQPLEVGLKKLETKGFNPVESTGRGALMLPFYRSHYEGRMIVAIDNAANTITFKGTVDPNYEIYMQTYGFGVYLGQAMNMTVDYDKDGDGNTDTFPTRPVYLFDRTGEYGFGHQDSCTGGTPPGQEEGVSDCTDSTIYGTCQACHTLTKYYKIDGTGKLHYNGSDCFECHSHARGFTATTVDHTADPIFLGRTPAECTGCHDPGLDSDYVSDIHQFNCQACHTANPPTLRTDYGSGASQIGPSKDCQGCHENGSNLTYITDFDNISTSHLVQDHSGLTGVTSSTPTDNCNGCHTGDIVNLDATPDVHNDNCQNCHNNITTDGRLHAGDIGASFNGAASSGTAASHAIYTISSCSDCHSNIGADFENHIYGTATDHAPGGSGSTMIQDTTAGTGDRSQENGTLCSDCHSDYDTQQATSDNLSTWRSIIYEHDLDGTKDGVGACVTCHNATRDVCANPAVCTQDGPTIQQVIAANGNPTHCQDCHEDKVDALSSNAAHGNHDTSAFGWDSNCVDCHSTTNNYVVQEVHNDNCDQCHSGGTYTADTNKIGSSTNGVDGDATLAEGDAPAFAATCTTCHPIAGGGGVNSIPDAHHLASPNNYAPSGQCTQCHADGGSYAGDHTSTVSLATNCADCHAGAEGNSGPTFNIPTLSGDNKVHDACTTCHQTSGGLTGAGGLAQVMDDNATFGGTDGGGSCEACHTNGFDGYHVSSVDHSTLVDTYANCSSCHTESGITVNPGDPKTHDACSTCHQADGRMSGSAVGNDGGTTGGSDGGGTCFTCHGEYFDSHTSIDHSTSVALDTNTAAKNECIDCHTGAQGDTSTVPLDAAVPTGDLKHDTCSTCHDADGALTGSAAGQDNSTPNGTDGGGDCTVCHGAYFDSHTHHSVYNQVSFNGTIDRSIELNDPSTACDQCHIPAGGLATWAGVYNEHSASCNVCHNFTTDATGDAGTPVVATVDTVIGTDGTANCTTCHVPKLWSSGASSTHGGHETTHFGWDGNCIDCHSTTNDFVVSEVHGGNCDLCHSGSPATVDNNGISAADAALNGKDGDAALAEGDKGTWAATCSTCHPADGNAGAFNTVPEAHHIAAPNDYAANDNCTFCHADSGTYAGDHTSTVAQATNCQDCHSGTPGNTGPTFNIPTSSGDNTIHDSCKTCHQTAGGLTGASGSASVMDDNGTYGGTDGGGNCEACHGAYFDSHTNIDHSTSVALDTATAGDIDCIDCHTGTEGDTSTVPLDPAPTTGDKLHDSCSQCHEANGALTGSAAGHDNATQNGTDGGGDCTVCHGAYFDSHTHHDGASNQVSFDSTVDRSQQTDADSSACYQCHDDAALGKGTSALSTWDSIRLEHDIHDGTPDATGGCTTCHDYTTVGELTGDANTPLLATVQSVIGTDATANCVTCHVPKDHPQASSSHGGHADSHFAWDGTCIDCHSTANDYVVSEVHSGDCDLCHTGGTYTADTNGISAADAALNGKDGDAALAEGDAGTWAATCSTCHPADGNSGAFNTVPLAHHVATPNNYAAADNCTFCHADSGSYAGDHTGTVSLAINCLDCHTGAEGNTGPTFNIPTSSGNNAVHDSCKTCHQTDGGLTGAGGLAQVMDDNATYGGTDGGGSCEACHTSGFGGYHVSSTSTVHSTSLVTAYGNCSGCHTATGSTLDSGDPTVHDFCSSCHSGDGRLVGSAETHNGGDNGGSNGGGTCFTCHGEYLPDHTNIDHSTSVALDTATGSNTDCIDCHTGAEGDTSTVPLDNRIPEGNKVHDSCLQCHNSAGALIGSANGNDGGTSNGTDGGGDCTVCHGAYFDSHTHHDNYNQVFFSSTVDRSQQTDDDANACYQCHDDATLGKGTSALSTWDSVRLEHDIHDGVKNATGGCTTCHDYAIEGEVTGDPNTPLASTVETVVGTDATANCVTCHVPKEHTQGTSTHGGHADSNFGWDGNCSDCHGAGGGTEAVVSNIHGNNCDLCHTGGTYTAGTNGIGTVANATDGKDGDAALAEGDAGTWTSTCTTCHPSDGNAGAFNTSVQAHHDASPNNIASNGNCDMCHTDPRLAYNGGVNVPYKQLMCANCHVVSDGGSGIKAVRFELRDPGQGANGTRAGNPQTDIAGHAWPNTSAINNYGACFYCHGQSGNAAGRSSEVTVPLHAKPLWTDKDTGADTGTPFVRDVNLIGGGGWQKDSYSGTGGVYGDWSIDKTKSGGLDYRGNEPSWLQSYYPLGKATINLCWAAFSQPKKATDGTVYKVNNTGLWADAKFNILQGVKFGYVADIQHWGNQSHFIPINDADPVTAFGVDTLTENTAFSINWVGAGGNPVTTRTITVDISSDDSSATLSLIYGGRVVATGSANGTLSTTVDLDAEATSRVGAASKEDLYHTNSAGVFWVASDKGGSIALYGHANQTQGYTP